MLDKYNLIIHIIEIQFSSSMKKNNQDKLRGVNLGGWLVLEKWITPSIFEGHEADDEYSLLNKIPKKTIREHYKNFIKEEDFSFLAKNDINALRIPVGYWIFGGFPPYEKNIQYLDFAFDMAEKYGLKVLIDIHGAPGSQNGYDHSGKTGEIGWDKDSKNIELTLKIIEKIAKRYCGRKALFGIEVLNEPHISIDIDLLKSFYENAYQTIRRVCGYDVAVVIGDSFRAFEFKNFMTYPRFTNVILDSHFYQCFSEEFKEMKLGEFLKRGKREWGRTIDKLQKHLPMISGEWSLALECKDFNEKLSENNNSEKKILKNYLSFKKMQSTVFDKSAGSFFWTYKTEGDVDWAWNFRKLVENGFKF